MNNLILIPYSEKQLVQQFYKSNREKIKVHKHDLCYLLFNEVDNKTPIAGVKFSCLPDGSWLLRNMLVDKAHRKQGIGHSFLSKLEPVLNDLYLNSSAVACFPWQELTAFYTYHGFSLVKDQMLELGGDASMQRLHLSKEICSRYFAYKRRGLDISLCAWYPSSGEQSGAD